jgi:hypothetical protein
MKCWRWWRALIALLMAGCTSLVPGIDLRGDMDALLQANGLSNAQLSCQMSARSRDGRCTLPLAQAEADALAAALQLTPAGDTPFMLITDSCAQLADFGPGTPATVRGISGRPASLQLSSGSQFEALVLYSRADLGAACIETSYAYG